MATKIGALFEAARPPDCPTARHEGETRTRVTDDSPVESRSYTHHMSKPYRRRSGVIWRPGQLGIPRESRTGWFWQSLWMNDGGEDAPMDVQSNRFFKHIAIGALVVVAVIV